ncbi:MAG TPA: sigma-70 family RNA polymerase sigma factor [Xanthomonadaceae bacterium]|nr:sigma-70 family RNA polymerase sigma factor [Xanthomonadaceae bacterium]
MHAESTPKVVTASSGTDADEALVRAAAGGDVAAFEALYRQYVRRVYAVVWRLIGGVDARAEELTQEAFVRAWQSLPKFRFESTFATWIHRLAVNTGLMDMRARRDGEDRETGGNSLAEIRIVDHAARNAELRIDLECAVALLPPRARAVLVLHDIEGWKHHEIADELGMAVGSSKAQLHRARSILREHFGDADFGHFDADCNDHGVAS